MTRQAQPLPSGIVTFVFTDIEGSTRLFRAHPLHYPALLARHRVLLAEAVRRHHGVVVSTEGDGTLIAFADPVEAVLASTEAQMAFAAEPWPDGIGVRVRIGMHSGLAEPLDGDYVAMAVHQAARVASTANGGQVVLSGATADLVRRAADLSGVHLRALGRFRVRDFDGPTELALAEAPGLTDPPQQVRATPAEGHNLRRPPTGLIGRQDDLAAVSAALHPGRVLTIVGPGGVGKSRLALEVGLRLAPAWPDGAWRLSVDDLPETAHLLSGLADVTGVRLQSAADPRELAEALADRRALIILDGCEHALGAVAALVAELLGTCPDVGVLATSQEGLHLRGEVIWRLAPLAVGDADTAADATKMDAVELFVARAEEVRPDFRLTDANASAITALARRLDGLPLALEVAAGLVSTYSVEQLLDGFEASLSLLRSRDQTLPARHRSLDALLTWSEELLTPAERAAFLRLSVLEGSFTVRTAQAVVAAAPLDAPEVPEQIWSLVERSLLVADNSGGGTRYRMLSLVRHFARGRLSPTEAHAALTRAADAFRTELGPQHLGDRTWMGRVAVDLDNVRGVLDGLTSELEPPAGEAAAELAVSVLRYRQALQRYAPGVAEGSRWCRRLPSSRAKVGVLTALADLALRMDDTAQAEGLVAEATELRTTHGAPSWDVVGVERALGEIANRAGRPERTVALANAALADPASPVAGDLRAQARLYNMLGNASVQLDDLDAAADAFAGELRVTRVLGDELLLTLSEANSAELALRRGKPLEAARHQAASLELAAALGQPVFLAYAMIVAVQVAAPPAKLQLQLLAKATALLDEAGHRLYQADERRLSELIAEARASVPDEAYRRAEAEGAAMTLDVALALTREQLRASSG